MQASIQAANQPRIEIFSDLFADVDASRLGLDPALVTVFGADGSHKYRATADDLRRAAEALGRCAERIEALEIVKAASLPEFN